MSNTRTNFLPKTASTDVLARRNQIVNHRAHGYNSRNLVSGTAATQVTLNLRGARLSSKEAQR